MANVILRHRKWLQAGFGGLLLALVIWKSNPQQLLLALQDAPLGYLIPWLLVYFLLTVVSWSLGVHVLLVRLRRGGLGPLIAASFKLQVLATVTPGRLGDLGLLYFLKGRFSPGQLTAVLVVDKLITLLVNVVLALWGVGVFFSWHQAFLLLLFLSVPGFVLLYWLLFHCPQAVFRWGLLANLIDKLEGLRSELRATCVDLPALAVNLGLTVFRYLLAGLSLLLILSWFEVAAPYGKVILVQAMSQLVALLPVTVMGIGVQEGIHVYLFGLIGIAPGRLLAAMLWGRAIHLLWILTIYLYWLAAKALPPANLTEPPRS